MQTRKKSGQKRVASKDISKRALAAAKELEKIPMPTREEIVKYYKEGLEEAKRLQRLLKPAWFVDDTDKPGKTSVDARAERREKIHAALLREKKHAPLLANRRKKPAKK
jgi:hypothetical protein